ncbi:unnamed protein product [Gongylonema pulchrum]|uniref:Uncharacterized protein n=1 Tax=Gongylonema pulchrum TaxID=637853 RepID=A0A3P6SU15_9BILA|nr:unnamed protein product [Gongylonema pulchrum]
MSDGTGLNAILTLDYRDEFSRKEVEEEAALEVKKKFVVGQGVKGGADALSWVEVAKACSVRQRPAESDSWTVSIEPVARCR